MFAKTVSNLRVVADVQICLMQLEKNYTRRALDHQYNLQTLHP